jgi:hypothetical protein
VQTILSAVSLVLVAFAGAPPAPQQPLRAELGVAHRQGKIDFKLAAVRSAAPAFAIGRPDAGAADAGPGLDRSPIEAEAEAETEADAAVAVAAKPYARPVEAAQPMPQPLAKPVPTAGCPGGVAIPAALSLAGAPALLVASASPQLVHFVAQLPPLLADGVVLAVGSLDAAGVTVVSRYATDFPAGVTLYAQAVVLVDGRILASAPQKFTGTGRHDG